ncbi:hypothetical protein ONS95_010047 [Cadophora gregata]|uniref:uncharacterized protein n=1 Tax=Cadophora gregata TaxID=51156 RepID=UPI0026DD8507|nr:uncharacterized protein ONS95_010047 [Cadophora gregata]KAK0121761.1 hypothetical protein ONS95_010047 [Cadophora gregata]
MERRKLQNREAQRRYRENIKRKLKIAERQLEDRGSLANVPQQFATNCVNEVNLPSEAQNGIEALHCASPIFDFDWMTLRPQCHIQDSDELASPPESSSIYSPARTSAGSTLIHVAAWKGYHAIVRILSNSGVDVACKDYAGQTPLHLAAAHGHTNTIKALIEVGAEVDARNHQGQTPLFVAVNNGEDDSVRVLLESGADPNARVSVTALGSEMAMMQDNTMEVLPAVVPKEV